MKEDCFNEFLLGWYNLYSSKSTDSIKEIDVETLSVDTLFEKDDFKINKSYCCATLPKTHSKDNVEYKLYFSTVDYLEVYNDNSIKNLLSVDYDIIKG